MRDETERKKAKELFRRQVSKNYRGALSEEWMRLKRYWRKQPNARSMEGGDTMGVKQVLLKALCSHDPNIVLMSLKIFEEWSKSSLPELQGRSSSGTDQGQQDLEKGFFSLDGAVEIVARHLSTILVRGVKDEQRTRSATSRLSVRAKALTVLANIPAASWKRLSDEAKNFIVEEAEAGFTSYLPPVRAASCRVAGVLYTYREVVDAFPRCFGRIAVTLAERLSGETEKTLSVRIRACWALANICDPEVFFTEDKGNKSEDIHPLIKLLDTHALVRIFESFIEAASGNAKLHPNAIRALGSLSRILTLDLSTADNREEKASDGLVQVWIKVCQLLNERIRAGTAGNISAKETWNATYAVGNVLSNRFVPRILENSREARELVSNAIGRLILLAARGDSRVSSNFKIRIHAVGALARIPSLKHFGDIQLFLKALRVFVSVVLNYHTGKTGSFIELQYEGQLRAKLFVGMCHFLSLSIAADQSMSGAIRQELCPVVKKLRELLDTEIEELQSWSNPEDWNPNETLTIAEFRLSAAPSLPLFRQAREILYKLYEKGI